MFRNFPSRYALGRLLPTLRLRPSGFLYNARNAESYSLNPVAATLVEALQRGVAPDLLWRELPSRFAVSEPQAHCDTLQFLSALHQLGLLALPKAEQNPGAEPDEQDELAELAEPAAAAPTVNLAKPAEPSNLAHPVEAGHPAPPVTQTSPLEGEERQ